MTSRLDVYNRYVEETWADPPSSVIEANEKYLSEDFHTLDKNGNVEMDRQTYIGMTRLLEASFSDFRAVYSDTHEEGDNVVVTYHFEGTQTGDLDLSAMGLGVIPASGKRVVWPEDTVEFGIEGEKIVSIRSHGDTGGTAAFFEALGVELPEA
jgi:predicted ester cyclase